ncbi:rhodanese-like domain-containing protein [Maribacter sp. 4G9]|uniref:rhodanese-like domain-containing protein n=1 Tax=Maribacter sp. 4G9 TaxID=1889777 RepID=UPI001F0B3A0C|nr:rhodanese-like domain-containing protein [Maribacter sp. 4G9]
MLQKVLSFLPVPFLFLMQTNAMMAQRSLDNTLKLLNKQSVPYIQPENLETNDSIVLLDARELGEFEVSHLKNAIWVGNSDFDPANVLQTIPEKDQPIVVYCSIGVRSEDIGEKLQELGYTNVKNLYGGIFEWKNQNGTVYNPKGVATDSVHAYNRLWGRLLKKGVKVYQP